MTETTKWAIGLIFAAILGFTGNYWATSMQVAKVSADVASLAETTNNNTKVIGELSNGLTDLGRIFAASEARAEASNKVLEKLDGTVDKLSDVVSRLDERTKP